MSLWPRWFPHTSTWPRWLGLSSCAPLARTHNTCPGVSKTRTSSSSSGVVPCVGLDPRAATSTDSWSDLAAVLLLDDSVCLRMERGWGLPAPESKGAPPPCCPLGLVVTASDSCLTYSHIHTAFSPLLTLLDGGNQKAKGSGSWKEKGRKQEAGRDGWVALSGEWEPGSDSKSVWQLTKTETKQVQRRMWRRRKPCIAHGDVSLSFSPCNRHLTQAIYEKTGFQALLT